MFTSVYSKLFKEVTKVLGFDSVELFEPVDQRYVWRKRKETYAEKITLSTVGHGGGSVMFWGCLLPLFFSGVEGKINSFKYQNILGENIMPLICLNCSCLICSFEIA